MSTSFQLPSLDNTWGAAYIGMVVASILYGITTLQIYLYYSNYPNDTRTLKLFVAALWVVDTLSLLLVTHGLYIYLIRSFFNPIGLLKIIWSIGVDPALGGLIALMAHAYLGTRAWNICNKNIYLGILLVVGSLGCFGLSIAAVVVAFRFAVWTNTPELKWLTIFANSVTIVLEFIIAAVLCSYLYKHRNTGQARTQRLVRRIMLYAVNTGLVASLMSVMNLVTYFAFPNTLIFLPFNFIVTKVYSNALMANLNARAPQDQRRESVIPISVNTSSMAQARHPMSALRFQKTTNHQATDFSVDSETGPISIIHEGSVHNSSSTQIEEKGTTNAI